MSWREHYGDPRLLRKARSVPRGFYSDHNDDDNYSGVDKSLENEGGIPNGIGLLVLVGAMLILITIGSAVLDNPIWEWVEIPALEGITMDTSIPIEGELPDLAGFDLNWVWQGLLILIVIIVIAKGIRIIRPTHRAAVETLGKYSSFKKSGITYVLPFIQKLYDVNITDQLVDVQRQEVITKDNLNCKVDAQVYYKVGDTEDDLKKALYKVNDYERQIVQLAKTTLRSVIGDNDFKTVNSQRGKLNEQVFKTMEKETKDWGINLVRVELKEIEPPADVQDTMNMVIKADNDKQSAINFANAVETKADGQRRAIIKDAEGVKRSQILKAEGEAQAIKTVAEAKAEEIKLVNESAEKYFKGNAQILEKLQVTRDALQRNTKYIMSKEGISPTLVVNESGDVVVPIAKHTPKRRPSSEVTQEY